VAVLRAQTYAKVNLSLEVLGRNPDGYHKVMTVLQTVDLADTLLFEPAPSISVECSMPELSGPENLVWMAAEALKKATGCDLGVKITIEKNIPVAMGLGGGSSDAAAALVALDRMWGLNMPPDRLCEIGSTLGADVPFLLRGGTALGEGRGDILTFLTPLNDRWLVLVCPSVSLERKTARLYSMLGSEAYTDGRVTRDLAGALERGDLSSEMLFNVFEQVALDAFPALNDAMEDMNQEGTSFVHLSGTGPALFALVSGKEDGQKLRKLLVQRGHRAHLLVTRESSPLLTLDSGGY
jgi:4-diphosphocytidyl-2-C-methyl-D-erythritol kinase